MKKTKEILSKQLNTNRDKNLLFYKLEEVLSIDPDFIRGITEIKNSKTGNYSREDIDALVEHTVDELLRKIYNINQFVQITEGDIKEVKGVYLETWEIIKNTDNVEDTIYKYHYPRLSLWLSKFYPPEINEIIKNQKTINKVTCEQYSPEFQISILRLDIKNLLGPIIDVGCGEHGNLVRKLREYGCDIIGIDRSIHDPEDYLLKTDWFSYDFTEETWGTVISNAAFSNHVIYSSNYDLNVYELYLEKYHEILKSIKPGGDFIYAPGLPLIEEHLDKNKYEVTKYAVTDEYYLSKIKKKVV